MAKRKVVSEANISPVVQTTPDEAAKQASIAQQQALMDALATEYQAQLEVRMGHLYQRMNMYISAARIPLPELLMVLEMLKYEAVKLAAEHYVGE